MTGSERMCTSYFTTTIKDNFPSDVEPERERNMERQNTRGLSHIGFAPRKRSKNARAGAGWNVGTMWPARRIVAKLKSCAGG